MSNSMAASQMKMVPKSALQQDVTLRTIEEMAQRLKNWGKWGPDDELGTLNYVTPADIVAAAALVRKGKAFALGLDFDQNGPQRTGWGGRFNPIHAMLATGTDAVAGRQDAGKIRYADDMVAMPLQCGTQWDALGHIFYGDKMWNGYDASLVGSTGAQKNAIHKTRDRMIGRGVLLDIPRFRGGDYLEDAYGIGSSELDQCAQAQGVEVRRGDFVIVRTGQMEQRLAQKDWGTYAAGDAPGLRFETCEWIHRNKIAAICSETWGCEVRPNEKLLRRAFQPLALDRVAIIPIIGITMGEIFYLRISPRTAPGQSLPSLLLLRIPLPITGAVGPPIRSHGR